MVHRGSSLRSTRLDQNDIAIFHNVILALRHHFPSCFHRCLITVFPQCFVAEHDALDEGLFKIWRHYQLRRLQGSRIQLTGVNDTSRLRCFCPLPDGPLSHLIRTRGEEAPQIHS